MLKPDCASRVTFAPNWRHRSPYPPLGFKPFIEYALGNGDLFGLYWPIGRESVEPLVVETWHDDGIVQPYYSSLARFLEAAPPDEEEQPPVPTLADDASSPFACLEAAREHIKLQEADQAVPLLERAASVLPEYTDALTALWGQYMRLGRKEEAAAVAVQAIISPPSFGTRPVQALRWLCSPGAPALGDDPIWQSRGELTLQFGGAKQNADYAVMRRAIEAYIARGDAVRASTLMQTYAELMVGETTSFQEREGFELQRFLEWQVEVSGKLAEGGRDLVIA